MVGKDAYFDLQIDKVSPSEALRALTLKKNGVWLTYNVVLVSAIQQSESIIHIHAFTLFKDSFPI